MVIKGGTYGMRNKGTFSLIRNHITHTAMFTELPPSQGCHTCHISWKVFHIEYSIKRGHNKNHNMDMCRDVIPTYIVGSLMFRNTHLNIFFDFRSLLVRMMFGSSRVIEPDVCLVCELLDSI